jgi:two-component system osmolarity sensor histidine kinase EnvZ
MSSTAKPSDEGGKSKGSSLLDAARARLAGLRLLMRRAGDGIADVMPKGLYARALIIIIAPIVLLESVIAFVFMERHWHHVTRRLSESTAHDVAALVEVLESFPRDGDHRRLGLIASRLAVTAHVLPPGPLPASRPKPFFDQLLDQTLTAELRKALTHPFWIDTVGDSSVVEIRVKLPDAILKVIAKRSQAYAANSHIFLLWMVGASIVLLTVSILFLRNQIRPIVRLAEAADAFGKGRPVPEDFRPRGAREVRQAAYAFLEMRDRIERQIEQRTTMLAGVSHDLRTILTRFKLQLAMLEDSPEIEGLHSDVDEMQHMLEDYLEFAKGYGGEESKPTDVRHVLEEIRSDAARSQKHVELRMVSRRKDMVLPLKRQAFKRAVMNLVNNAVRYGEDVRISCLTDRRWLRIEVDDDGPGIPEDKREIVFRPFFRLDPARNQDAPNTGLGLAIARDIARSHGGEIWLDASEMGGLKAIIRVPI